MGVHLCLMGLKFLRFLKRDKAMLRFLQEVSQNKYNKLFNSWKYTTVFYWKYYFILTLNFILGNLKDNYDNLKIAFGINLKKIRKDKKLSLLKLAAKCNLDDSQISKIEHGVWDVQLSTIFELAKGLEVEPKVLLEFDL